jgi:hypothetical protein
MTDRQIAPPYERMQTRSLAIDPSTDGADPQNLVHKWRTEQLRSPKATIHSMDKGAGQEAFTDSSQQRPLPGRTACRTDHMTDIEQYKTSGQNHFWPDVRRSPDGDPCTSVHIDSRTQAAGLRVFKIVTQWVLP